MQKAAPKNIKFSKNHKILRSAKNGRNVKAIALAKS